MPSFRTNIEIEIEIDYTTDQELRQGDDARYPSQPYVDYLDYTIIDDIEKKCREEAEQHLEDN